MFIIPYIYNNPLFDEIRRLYRLYRPYFGISGENRWRALGGLSIICFSLISSFSMVYIQEAFSVMTVVIMQPGITLSVFGSSVLGCLVPILIFSGCLSIAWSISSWLSENLAYELSQSLIAKWIDDASYNGLKFINDKREKVNPAIVLNNDLHVVCNESISLGSSLIQAFFGFCVGIYQLWIMSSPLILSIFSMTVAIPAYMVLAAIGFSAVYSLTINFFDKDLKKVEKELRHESDVLTECLHHVHEHSESILLKGGSSTERKRLLQHLTIISIIQKTKRSVEAIIQFIQNIGMNVSYLFGMILAAPSLIAGTLDPSNIFSIGSYFSSIVSFFTWKKSNTNTIISLNASLDRFESFNDLMKEWDRIKTSNKLTITKQSGTFGMRDVCVFTPSSVMIFDQVSFDILVGKATVIQGPSGVGKTTIFRCLAGLWPYVNGEIILPDNNKTNVYYIPQQPYFPYRGRLVDAITYPTEEQPTEEERNTIIRLMKSLGFSDENVKNLDQRDEWNKRLSGGEQQKIAIIGAILKKPDILFIDEGTNALDSKTKQIAESALKAHLTSTTIIAIDHHSEPPTGNGPLFFDYELKIDKSKDSNDKTTITLHECETKSFSSPISVH